MLFRSVQSLPGCRIDNPAVIELLKGYGRGELQHGAAQAAAWHLNSNMTWDELAAKQTGTERSFNRSPYFSRDELRTGMAYAAEAIRRGEVAEAEKAAAEREADEKDADEAPEETVIEEDVNDSESRSTQD